MNRRQLTGLALGTVVYPFAARAQDHSEYQMIDDPDAIWSDKRSYLLQPVILTGIVSNTVEITGRTAGVRFDRHLLLKLLAGSGTRWAVIGIPDHIPDYLAGDVVRVLCRLQSLSLELTVDGTSVDGFYFAVDDMEIAGPRGSLDQPSVTPVTSDDPTPLGEVLEFDGWEVEIADVYVLPDSPGSSLLYYLLVDLNLRNTISEQRKFDGPDTEFSIRSEQGWTGRYDLIGSAQIRAAEEQWTRFMTDGFDYPYTLVFAVWKHDPNLYQEGLSGWVLTITKNGQSHQIEVGDARDPGGITG